VPLAPGAPPVTAGQVLRIECQDANTMTSIGAITSDAAPGDATVWRLKDPASRDYPAGAQIWFDRVTHISSVADLHLRPGDSVYVEFTGKPGSYEASRLTRIGLAQERGG
jgi:hypothetical protein